MKLTIVTLLAIVAYASCASSKSKAYWNCLRRSVNKCTRDCTKEARNSQRSYAPRRNANKCRMELKKAFRLVFKDARKCAVAKSASCINYSPIASLRTIPYVEDFLSGCPWDGECATLLTECNTKHGCADDAAIVGEWDTCVRDEVAKQQPGPNCDAVKAAAANSTATTQAGAVTTPTLPPGATTPTLPPGATPTVPPVTTPEATVTTPGLPPATTPQVPTVTTPALG